MMNIFTSGTWQNRAWHIAVALLAFGIPVLTFQFPEWQNITLGTIVFGIYHFAEAKLG